jgi:hypothetical protein
MTDMVSINNGYGIFMNVGYNGVDGDVIMQNSHIYGDGPIPDCLPGNECFKIDKVGIMTPVITGAGKPVHITKPSKLPQ